MNTIKRWILALGAVLCMSASAQTTQLPPNAVKYLPSLREAIVAVWPATSYPHWFAGQIEQESCISLTSKGCWNPNTELKTSREYGFGLGQITIAYNANGTERFNNFKAMTSKYAVLHDWNWEDRYDPKYQIEAMMLMDRESFVSAGKLTNSLPDQYRFMLSAYNGGLGGLIQDRKLCTTIKGCNPNLWYGNVELHSFKAKTKFQGYGQSAFQINRTYVSNIEKIRSPKYAPYFQDLIKANAPK